MVKKHKFTKVVLAISIKISMCSVFPLTEILFLEFYPIDSMLVYLCKCVPIQIIYLNNIHCSIVNTEGKK